MDKKRKYVESKVDAEELLSGITFSDFEDEDEQCSDEKKYESEIAVDLRKSYFKHLNREEEANTLHSALCEESRRWRFFRKQDDLLDCFKRHRALNVLPFVFHDALRCTRTFVLVHPLELLFRTKYRTPNYFYEIIADGVPSKLYLDLEFDKKANPHVDGEKITKLVIDLCIEHINSRMDLALDRQVVVDFESSTDEKFSRHVIFNTFFCFKDNGVVGSVVRDFTQNGQHPLLKVQKKDGWTTCIVDLCVYTRNRHFRILGSTKFGRKAPLVLSDSGKSMLKLPVVNDTLRTEVLFLSSLITASNCPILPYTPLAVSKPMPKSTTSSVSAAPSHQSELPQLDVFFTKILSSVGLKKILVYPSGYVIYSSGPSGFCLNKGAAHKRHRIYWVVARNLGIFYQKCGDKQDCGEFRSPKQILPEPLLIQARGPLDAWEQALSGPTSDAPLKMKKLPTDVAYANMQ